MATGATANYDIPFPLSSDPVNIHEDLQDLAEQIELILPDLVNHTIEVRNVSGASIAKATPVFVTGFNTKTTIEKLLFAKSRWIHCWSKCYFTTAKNL